MFIPEPDYKKIQSLIPIACVDTLILYRGKCLLLKRANEPAEGQYWFPGGRINKMESISNAAIRKAKEETNLTCTFKQIITVQESIFKKEKNHSSDFHTINICCLLETENPDTIMIDNNHIDYIWVNPSLIPDYLTLHGAVRVPLTNLAHLVELKN